MSTDIAAKPEMLAMSVAKMGFLVDRLNRDCAPLQFVRELTKNAMQGIERVPGQVGEIRWDVDWRRHSQTGPGSAMKLSIVDTGSGMTGPEMVEFINKLSSSIHQQSDTGNFGVGSKIAAAPLNPEGMVYLSWKDGAGAMIHLFKDATGEYGLRRFENGLYWQPIDDAMKPEPIKDHGTMVVLLGRDADDSTIDAPVGTQNPNQWILRYLNTRFLEFAPGTTVRTRVGWRSPFGSPQNGLPAVSGMKPWLTRNSQSFGAAILPKSGATVHWWILKADAESGNWNYIPEGHIAALFQSELYEMQIRTSGFVRMQSFGILFGAERVVLYVEPNPSATSLVTANTARTHLLVNNQGLDWGQYAIEFRALMPAELVAFQENFGADSQREQRTEQIRDRLKTLRSLFQFGGYKKPVQKPAAPSKPAEAKPALQLVDKPQPPKPETTAIDKPKPKPAQPDILSQFADEIDDGMEKIETPPQPETRWVSVVDGSRGPNDMVKRAARYLPEHNMLLINGDFKGFNDLIDRWTERFIHVPGARQAAQAIAREWFEQQLIETIMGAMSLKEDVSWTMADLAGLWTEHALTAAAMPRYHVDQVMRKAMIERLGPAVRAA
ncbi:hypothetical protein [Sphingomonas sp. MMS24-J13]|uniref:hypothetical protein n=1 Tax=Sphingomonas sp. MMS24-J13 TaxID=3238686 RepID=UPI00384B5E3E